MKGIAGEVVSVKLLRSGVILVEATRKTQAEHLIKQTVFASIPVKVTAHRTLNSSKGVVRSFELSRMNSDELVEELAPTGVTAARVVTQKRGGVVRKTPVIILTFNSPTPPKYIRAGYLQLTVDRYIPNPLRCYNCQAFGHHESSCKKSKLCAKCGLTSHGDAECTSATKCVNCQGEHPAFSTSCPKWILEKEICRVKATDSLSFPEARRIVAARPLNTSVRSTSTTYATALSSSHTITETKTYVSTQTQTDVTWCKCEPNYQTTTVSNETQTDIPIVNTQTSTNVASTSQKQDVNVRWRKSSRAKFQADQGRGKADPTGRPTGGRTASAGDAAEDRNDRPIFRAGNSPRMKINL